MGESLVVIEKCDHVSILRINNPPLNVLTSSVYEELDLALDQLAEDNSVRVVILTGTGDRAFCAGANIHEFVTLDSLTGYQYSARNQLIRNKLWRMPQPVIAAVNGAALGAGCVLTMLCDLRVVAENVKFGLGEINLGIIGGVQVALRMLPSGAARRMIYSGETISALEAHRLGLADVIVSPIKVMDEAVVLAEKIARKSPSGVRAAKRVVVNSYEKTLAESMREELDELRILWSSADRKEAVSAFLEKRDPVF